MGILSGELTFEEALGSLGKMPKQKQFITATYPNVAYVGGEGSGKSVALMTDCIMNCVAEPHGLTLVGRLNMPALETSTMRTFLEMVPDGYGDWAEAKKVYTFKNGHEVVFRHLDITDPKVVGHIKSMNLSRAYVDEASEISEQVFFVILGRLRRKSTQRHTFKMASNPAGHDWMWRYFFDPERKKEWREKNFGITASSFDNPFLPAEYLEIRKSLYPADWADRFIYGNFSDFSDLVYKEVTEQTHGWNADMPQAFFGGQRVPPKEWPIIAGIDIGSDIDPWAIVLVAVAPNGMLFQFAEVYGNSLLIKNIARDMKLKIEDRPVDGIAYDYANRQAALELSEYDIAGQPALKEVRPGLFKCAQYLHVDERLQHPFTNDKGAPRYYISNHCSNTWRELLAYKWARDRSGNPTGEPSHENSHSPDAVRYAIHTFRPLPEKLKEPKLWENPNLDAMSRMYWMQADKFKDRMERFKPHGASPKTVQEWQREALKPPVRFQRPRQARFSRV